MALIIYPTTGYDSFVSLADAETILENNVPPSQRLDWDAIVEDTTKQIYLRQATLVIKGKITLPDTLEDDLKLAAAYLANYSIGKDMVDDNDKDKIKRKKVDDIEVEYFSGRDADNELPDLVVNLLRQYEVSSSGSFSFNRG